MIEAAGPILDGHPTALAWGQAITAVVALASFVWAAQYARPKRGEPKREPQRRLDKVEGQVGTLKVCNPGRRSTDRCILCPMDDRCERYPRLARTPSEIARDEQLVAAMATRKAALEARGTVVVVEDHDVVMQVTCALLEQVGIHARGAHTIAEAQPFLPSDGVLVADWNLPDGTALDAISAFHAEHPEGGVILTSALDVQPEAVPDGAVWMPKPFDPDYFLSVVRKMLNKKPGEKVVE